MKIRNLQIAILGLLVFATSSFGQYGQPSGQYIPRYPLHQNRGDARTPQIPQRIYTPSTSIQTQGNARLASNTPYGYQDNAPANDGPMPAALPNPNNQGPGAVERLPGGNQKQNRAGAPVQQNSGLYNPMQGSPVQPMIQNGNPGVVVPDYPNHNGAIIHQGAPVQHGSVMQQGSVIQQGPVIQQETVVHQGYPNQQHGQVYQQQIQPIPMEQNNFQQYGGVQSGGNVYYDSTVSPYYGNAAVSNYSLGGYSSGACLPAPVAAPVFVRPKMWFGSIGGLVFNRDFEDDVIFAYPFGLPATYSLNSTDATPGAMGGVEAIFGRKFCNGYILQANYWGLFSETGVTEASGGNPQTTFGTLSTLDYNPGGGANPVNGYVNAAASFRARRTNEFHNIELNFIKHTFAMRNFNCNTCGYGAGGCGVGGYGVGAGSCGTCYDPCSACGTNCGGACGYGGGCGYGGCGAGLGSRLANPRPFRFDMIGGVRFFKFDENFFFRTSTAGDYMPHVNDLYYDIDLDNNLVGFQLGGQVEYCFHPRWKFVGGTKFGIFGNSISQRSQIYGLSGYAYANSGAYNSQNYDISSNKTDVAFLGQLDLGLDYCINPCWNLGFGYRVVSVNGVALAPEQVPYNFADYAEAQNINSNGGLILHGAYLRLQYNF